MKIVIDCCFKLHDGDGIARYINQLKDRLDEENITFINQDYPPIFTGKLRFLRRLYYILILNVMVPLNLKRNSVDIYHNLNISLPLIKIEHCKYVATVHDLAHKIYPQSQKRSWRVYYDFMFRCLQKNADMVICVSKTTLKKLSEYYPGSYQGSYIHLGTDHIQAPEYINKERKNVILFVGTIEPRKNLETLLDAYIQLEPEFKEKYPLMVIGRPGWLSQKTIERLKMLESQENILWKNNATDEELIDAYTRANLFVLPSYYEGYGFPIFEALNFGVQILVSDIEIFKELLGDYDHYFDPFDSHDLKDKLVKKLTKNPEIPKIEMNTWKIHVDKLRNLYAQL